MLGSLMVFARFDILIRHGRVHVAILLILFATLAGGCAIHYYDPDTGTEHLWGIGHMRMKVGETNEGVRAVVTGTDTVGLAGGSAPSERYIAIGWQRLSRLQVLDADTSIRLEWPSADLTSVRVGSGLPPVLNPGENRDDQKRKNH
jgi:hypothetical protein